MDLECRALIQFDRLVSQGELHWEDSRVRIVESKSSTVSSFTKGCMANRRSWLTMPFYFEFRIAKASNKKPRNADNRKASNDFSDGAPDCEIGHDGP